MPAAKKADCLQPIPVLSKALNVLEFLERKDETLSLADIHRSCSASKTTVFGILQTLVHRGYIAKTTHGGYRYVARPQKLRFGFECHSEDNFFSLSLLRSLQAAALAAGVDLVVLHNDNDTGSAKQNIQKSIREPVDIVIASRIDRHIAPILADRIAGAEIPLIAVDVPCPHATYFGIDNYRVGRDTGELLAKHAMIHWGGEVHAVVSLGIEKTGLLIHSLITGTFDAVRSRLPDVPIERFIRIDGCAQKEESYQAILSFFNRDPNVSRVLIAAANDASATGAIAAVRELRREESVAIVVQDSLDEMLKEMQRHDSPAIAFIVHGGDLYGAKLIELGLALLRGVAVPPYNYVKHQVITADRVRKHAQS